MSYSILVGRIIGWLLFPCLSVVVLTLALKMRTLILSGVGAWVGFLLGDSRVGKNQVPSGIVYYFYNNDMFSALVFRFM